VCVCVCVCVARLRSYKYRKVVCATGYVTLMISLILSATTVVFSFLLKLDDVVTVVM
jgi:hypothetical protein